MSHSIRSLKLGRTLALAACVLFVSTSMVDADDWPHWRGPNHNDRSAETGLLKKWPESGPKQLWTSKKCGLGYAGFAVVGDELYTLGMEDSGEFALCLNAETGEEIWRQTIAAIGANRGNSTAGWGDGSRSSPTVDGDHVYLMSCSGTLACLDRKDGKKVWSVEMSDFGGKVPSWGYSESPLVHGKNVICTPGGQEGAILSLDKKTGKKVWQTQSLKSPAHYSSVLPVEYQGKPQLVQMLVDQIVGVEPESGKVLWQSDWYGRVAAIPSPIFKEGRAYVTAGYNVGSKAVDLDTKNKVKDAWTHKGMSNHHGGVVLVDGYLYGFTDTKRASGFACQDFKTGEIVWREGSVKKGALTYADGRLYHVEESSGRVVLIDPSPKGLKVVSSFTIGPQSKRRHRSGKIWTHPVIADGKVYLRDQEIVYCYDLKNKS